MGMMSIVGIVLIVLAALLIKKVVGMALKAVMFLMLVAGLYFFFGPMFGLPVLTF